MCSSKSNIIVMIAELTREKTNMIEIQSSNPSAVESGFLEFFSWFSGSLSFILLTSFNSGPVPTVFSRTGERMEVRATSYPYIL